MEAPFFLTGAGIAVATAVAWTVGWRIASSVGVQTEAGWPVFGVSGAIVAQALSGLVVVGMGRTTPARATA